MREINLNRQLLGLEDLEFGTGIVEQTRAGTKVNITKINAGNLPFDETRTFVEFAQDTNLEELGNSVEAINNLNNDLDKLLIVEDNLPEVISVAQNIVPNLTEILNVDTLAAQVTQDKASVSTMKLVVETIYDTFDDRFLGTKTVDPILDNDGNILLDGAIYFNTSSNTMKVYNIDTTTWYSIPQIYLSALLDVNLTSITSGNVLRWNGTKWINHTLSKGDVGLNLVDNTSDTNKPVSTAVQIALNLKAPLDSAALVNPTINGVAQSGYTGFKNYIINGGFDIFQRNNNIATSGYTYGADRFYFWTSTEGTTRKSTIGSTIGYYNSGEVYASTVGHCVVGQRIEAVNTIRLGAKGATSMTFSFHAKTSSNTTIAASVVIPTTTDNYGAVTTVKNVTVTTASGTAWAKYTVTFPLDFVYWGGLAIVLTTGVISQFNTTGWQLEEGSVATSFENRPVGLELSLCQRYYCITYAYGRWYASAASHTLETPIYWPTTMRVIPTTTLSGAAPLNCTAVLSATASVTSSRLSLTSSAAGEAFLIGGTVTASAEL